MLLAPSGCGKTTLATRLTENGFRFLSDDVTVIDRKTLEVIPFPRAVKILRADKEPLFINIEEIYPSSIGIRCTLQYLIFVEPYYETKGKTVTLKQVSKSEAFKGLFKFHVADKTTDLNKSLNTISSLVNMSECYRLIPGKLEDVISSIIDLAKTGR